MSGINRFGLAVLLSILIARQGKAFPADFWGATLLVGGVVIGVFCLCLTQQKPPATLTDAESYQRLGMHID